MITIDFIHHVLLFINHIVGYKYTHHQKKLTKIALDQCILYNFLLELSYIIGGCVSVPQPCPCCMNVSTQ